jgi:hypothetical protein
MTYPTISAGSEFDKDSVNKRLTEVFH